MIMTNMMSMTSILIVACIIKCLFELVTLTMEQDPNRNLSYLSSTGSSGSLNFMTWNASGIMSSGTYLGYILGEYDVDFCGVSEHCLYKRDHHFLDSIHKSDNYFAVSDYDLEAPSGRKVGKGGVALSWKKSLGNRVAILNIEDDRIVGIQYQISSNNYVYIIQVYLPSSNHPISELSDYLLKLQNIYS